VITYVNSQVKIEKDRIGNLVLHKKGTESNLRVMIIVHMGEVGI